VTPVVVHRCAGGKWDGNRDTQDKYASHGADKLKSMTATGLLRLLIDYKSYRLVPPPPVMRRGSDLHRSSHTRRRRFGPKFLRSCYSTLGGAFGRSPSGCPQTVEMLSLMQIAPEEEISESGGSGFFSSSTQPNRRAQRIAMMKALRPTFTHYHLHARLHRSKVSRPRCFSGAKSRAWRAAGF